MKVISIIISCFMAFYFFNVNFTGAKVGTVEDLVGIMFLGISLIVLALPKSKETKRQETPQKDI